MKRMIAILLLASFTLCNKFTTTNIGDFVCFPYEQADLLADELEQGRSNIILLDLYRQKIDILQLSHNEIYTRNKREKIKVGIISFSSGVVITIISIILKNLTI